MKTYKVIIEDFTLPPKFTRLPKYPTSAVCTQPSPTLGWSLTRGKPSPLIKNTERMGV